MQAEYIEKCSLCLVSEKEVTPFLEKLKAKHPSITMDLSQMPGVIQLTFQSDKPLDSLIKDVERKFPSFFLTEATIEEALQQEMVRRKKTLSLAESCTGGALASKITALPGASEYFLVSMVVYSNTLKERFLHVSTTLIKQHGAVSRQTAVAMLEGLFQETDADFGAAITGTAGPSGGTKNKPVGTVYVAIGERGKKIDAGPIHAEGPRADIIELAVQLTLGGLWRRLVHNTPTFS
jgi:PncC family amidohydrolase